MPMVTAAPQPRGASAFDAERKRGDGTMRRHNGVDLFAPKGHMVTAWAATPMRPASRVVIAISKP